MQSTRRARDVVLAASLLTVALSAPACCSGIAASLPGATGGSTMWAKPPNDLGIVPPAVLAALDAAIRTTDFTALKCHPSTGRCPTAFDGQEIVFEFGAPGGVQRIATCEGDVDFGLPLFVAVSTALGAFAGLPTP